MGFHLLTVRYISCHAIIMFVNVYFILSFTMISFLVFVVVVVVVV